MLTATLPEVTGLGRWDARLLDDAETVRPASPSGGAGRPPFLPWEGGGRPARTDAGRGTIRDAWVGWLAPWFADNGSAYFTGTYSDEYGYSHGLMLARNVQKDWLRFIRDLGLSCRRWVCAVEPHRDRSILHLHAMLEGPASEDARRVLKAAWQVERGWAKVLPVLDDCSSYVTKYALKSTVEAFDFHL